VTLKIENVEQLSELIKQTGVQVNSIDDLKELLTTVNAQQDRVSRMQTAVLPVGIAAAAAGIATIVLLAVSGDPGRQALDGETLLGVLGILWGAVAFLGLVSGVCMIVLAVRDRVQPSTPTLSSPRLGPPNSLPHSRGVLRGD
jgi:hypothetical protein